MKKVAKKRASRTINHLLGRKYRLANITRWHEFCRKKKLSHRIPLWKSLRRYTGRGKMGIGKDLDFNFWWRNCFL